MKNEKQGKLVNVLGELEALDRVRAKTALARLVDAHAKRETRP